MQIPVLLCALLATANGAFGQKPEGRADARADAKADARADASGRSSDSSRSSHTSTHRVVVENGKTIVDERTEDGRVVPSGGGAGGALPGGLPLPGGVPALPALDPEEMLRKLREQLDRELGGAVPSIPLDGKWPLDGRRIDVRDGRHSASDSAKDSSSSSSSSSSRDAGHKSPDAKGTDAKTSGAKITNSKSSGSKPASRLTPATVDFPAKPKAEPPATKGGTLTPRQK